MMLSTLFGVVTGEDAAEKNPAGPRISFTPLSKTSLLAAAVTPSRVLLASSTTTSTWYFSPLTVMPPFSFIMSAAICASWAPGTSLGEKNPLKQAIMPMVSFFSAAAFDCLTKTAVTTAHTTNRMKKPVTSFCDFFCFITAPLIFWCVGRNRRHLPAWSA